MSYRTIVQEGGFAVDVVIVANFCMDFSEYENGRFTYLARLLSKEHNVELVTSRFSHAAKTHRKEADYRKDQYQVTLIDEPGYRKNISLRRFYSHYAWGKNVLKYLKNRKKPDVIYCAVPSFSGPAKIGKFCKKNGIKFVIDVNDIWPEAFKMVLNVPVVSDLIFLPLTVLANKVYRNADEICAVSQTYADRGMRKNKKCSSPHIVYLGTDLDTFDEGKAQKPMETKPEGEIWLGYCGSLGKSYDIPCVIRALELLKRPDVRLIVMGDGENRAAYQALAKEKGVNALFAGRLAYGPMCALLSQCDMTVNPITGGSAGSIINKHGDYAAVGLPVLNTQDSLEYRQLVDIYQMGLNCRNGDAADLAEKLQILLNDPELCKKMGENARRCAEERFDRRHTYPKLVRAVVGKK